MTGIVDFLVEGQPVVTVIVDQIGVRSFESLSVSIALRYMNSNLQMREEMEGS